MSINHNTVTSRWVTLSSIDNKETEQFFSILVLWVEQRVHLMTPPFIIVHILCCCPFCMMRKHHAHTVIHLSDAIYSVCVEMMSATATSWDDLRTARTRALKFKSRAHHKASFGREDARCAASMACQQAIFDRSSPQSARDSIRRTPFGLVSHLTQRRWLIKYANRRLWWWWSFSGSFLCAGFGVCVNMGMCEAFFLNIVQELKSSISGADACKDRMRNSWLDVMCWWTISECLSSFFFLYTNLPVDMSDTVQCLHFSSTNNMISINFCHVLSYIVHTAWAATLLRFVIQIWPRSSSSLTWNKHTLIAVLIYTYMFEYIPGITANTLI